METSLAIALELIVAAGPALAFGMSSAILEVCAGMLIATFARLLGDAGWGTGLFRLAVAVVLTFAATFLPPRYLLSTDGRLAGVLFNRRLTFGIVVARVGARNARAGEAAARADR